MRKLHVFLYGFIFTILTLAVFLVGCGGSGGYGEGAGDVGVCEECETTADCQAGLTCELYAGGGTFVDLCSDGREFC